MKYMVTILVLWAALCGAPQAEAGIGSKILTGIRHGAPTITKAEVAEETAESALKAGGVAAAAATLLAAASGEEEEEEPTGKDKEKRTWGARGLDMLGAFVHGGMEGAADLPATKVLSRALKESFDVLIKDYKEEYKEEGRTYAKELGDIVVDRVRKDPQISSTLTSLQILCWVVIIYLTFVTIFIVIAMRRIRKDVQRIEQAIRK